jgi:hypothetical protein
VNDQIDLTTYADMWDGFGWIIVYITPTPDGYEPHTELFVTNDAKETKEAALKRWDELAARDDVLRIMGGRVAREARRLPPIQGRDMILPGGHTFKINNSRIIT